MSKARRRKGIGYKKLTSWRQRAQSNPISQTKRWLSRSFLVFGILGTSLGIYTFGVPRLSVAPLSSLDSNNPLATPFAVSNDGYLPISNVDFICGIGHLDFENGSRFEEFGMTTTQMHEKRIGPNEQATVRCDWMVQGSPIVSGDISIIVRFETFMIPHQFDKSFRFVAVQRADGIFQWMPKPNSN